MRVIYNDGFFKKLTCVATIGVFDGAHLGHQFIFKKLKELSTLNKFPSLVITFDIPPQKLLKKKFIGLLCNLEDKKKFIGEFDIDYLWILKTTKTLLELTPKQFIDYLFSKIELKGLIIGKDFKFGYGTKGNLNYLKKLTKIYNFYLKTFEKLKIKNEIVSSTFIKKLIRDGFFEKAKNFLGRDYWLRGRVIKGKGLGKFLGFCTANIDFGDYVVPKDGVYVGYTILNEKKYLSAINIGKNPTVSNSKMIHLEAHLINFNQNILNKNVKIIFLKKIRNEKKFASLEKLREAIKRDVEYIINNFPQL